MPRVADQGFADGFAMRRDQLIAAVQSRLEPAPQMFTEAATWLHETWTESAVRKLLAARDLDRRRRSLGSSSGPSRTKRPKAQELRLPGDQLRADRLEHAVRWLIGKNQGNGVLRLLGGNQSKSVLSRNAIRVVLVAACIVDPDAGEWLGSITPLASAPWESAQPKGKRAIKGRADVCSVFGNEALTLMEEAIKVLGWTTTLEVQPAKPPVPGTPSQRWNVSAEMRETIKTKLHTVVFDPKVEDAVRVDAGLTLMTFYGLQLLPGKQELPNPIEHQPTMEVWRGLYDPLERLAILAESRGIDSTPLRELVPCRTFAETDQLQKLVERLDVIAQAMAKGELQSPSKSSQDRKPDPRPRKPGGWTTGELCEEAGIGHTAFGRIRTRAEVKASARGGAGTQRRFSNAELRKLIQAAETGPYRKGKAIGAAWRQLLSAN